MNKFIPLTTSILMMMGCASTPEKTEVEKINASMQDYPTAAGRDGSKWNIPPLARIRTVSARGKAPFTAVFDGSRSRDRNGSISIYNWDFGDGSNGTGVRTNHEFTTPGNYTVTLSVTDNQGATKSASTEITVISPPKPTPFYSRPVGIYSLDKLVDLPFVSGVAKRIFWSEIEPEEGVYDFSSIEKIVREAELAGQSVTIATLLFDEPAWLLNITPDEDKYRGMNSIDIAPWSENMLKALRKLAYAQSNFKVDGIALKDHPTVKQITASVGTMNSIRMRTIPQNYTPELLKESVKRSIRFWVNAYPDKHIYIGFFGINDGTRTTSKTISTADELKAELLAEFNGIDNPRINFFIEYWTGQNPKKNNQALNGLKDVTSIMMQACGSWITQDTVWEQCGWLSPQDTPEHGFNQAMENYNTTYFEVYRSDLNNPDYYEQFDEAASKIRELGDILN